jgi:hypothetical protein
MPAQGRSGCPTPCRRPGSRRVPPADEHDPELWRMASRMESASR